MQYNLVVMSSHSTFCLILSLQLIFSVQLHGKTPLEMVAAPTDGAGVAPSSAPQTRPPRCLRGAGSCPDKLLQMLPKKNLCSHEIACFL